MNIKTTYITKGPISICAIQINMSEFINRISHLLIPTNAQLAKPLKGHPMFAQNAIDNLIMASLTTRYAKNIRTLRSNNPNDAGEKVIFLIGKACCAKQDTYDPEIGKRLAKMRAQEQIYRAEIRIMSEVWYELKDLENLVNDNMYTLDAAREANVKAIDELIHQ